MLCNIKSVSRNLTKIYIYEGGENGYVLEVFNAIGESINVIIVHKSAVEPLKQDEILSVRFLVEIT
ncbi:MAG: hypothetical protein SWX82_17045 [Cyanobacteriota bacterium]|nr:hypothetical protein [Cyanobacteriota bacterium]